MSVKISGVMKDGMGNPVADCTIELRAGRTTSTVIKKTVAMLRTRDDGSYSMQVETGMYHVILHVSGFPPANVGHIRVTEKSTPGTLNDYLMNAGPAQGDSDPGSPDPGEPDPGETQPTDPDTVININRAMAFTAHKIQEPVLVNRAMVALMVTGVD